MPGKTVFLIIVSVGIVFWIGTTLLALRKHKMFAIAAFFAIPCGLVFLWLLIYILLLVTGYNPTKEEGSKIPTIASENETP